MKALLISIKPEYVTKILDGSKTFEFRKRLCKEGVSLMIIHSTSPMMKVVASAKILGKLSRSPRDLWKETKQSAGISYKEYRSYFKGCKTAYAYELGEATIFEPEKNLSDYGIRTAPQSFAYIEV
ncbi:MAG: hypothetical protein ACI32C_00075 [Candidatus Enteromonas sp.]